MEKKVVLITGASSGCGKETAKQLISQGYKVYAVSRRIEQMQDLQSLGAVCLKMDITINDDIKKVIERIKDDENKIDILINNAGYGQFGSIEDVSEIDARRQYDVNVFGVANMIKSSLHLLRNSKDARIVNVSSIAAKIPGPSAGWYFSSKNALEGLSDALRIELKNQKIKVIIIEPGKVSTEFESVTIDNLKKIKTTSYYSKNVDSWTELFSKKSKTDISASQVAKKIIKSIKARKPKPRYTVGVFTKLLIFVKRITTDKFLDKQIARSFN